MAERGLDRLAAGRLAPGSWRIGPSAEPLLVEMMGAAADSGWFCHRIDAGPGDGRALFAALSTELGLPEPVGADGEAPATRLAGGDWPRGSRVLVVVDAPHGDTAAAAMLDEVVGEAAGALARCGVGLYLVWIGGTLGADLGYWEGLD